MTPLSKVWPGLWRDLVLNWAIASPLVPVPARWRLLRAYGMNVERCRVSPGIWFGSSRVRIGPGTYINYGCMFNTSAPISLGQKCDVGMRVLFVTSSHALAGPERRAGRRSDLPIEVGDGCWIGADATILPGVTIGTGCVIAAGAVVASDCAPNGLYGGVPAKLLRQLTPAVP